MKGEDVHVRFAQSLARRINQSGGNRDRGTKMQNLL